MMELIGLLLPPVIDLINRKILNADLRFWVSVAFCIVVGVILQVTSGGGNAEEYFRSILVIFGLAQISYKAVYEDSRLQTQLRG